ncbi:MAG: hypothetical protein FD123_3539 [Bacteroidetes bacterium]|nr:MAG: hypothetical protein FD123_3539 [Bacteroidota bacterium]
MNPMENFLVTLDIDWAPDYMLDEISALLEAKKVRATWFVTHDSPSVRRIAAHPLFEAGIHPNFLPGSSHGNTTEQVLAHLLQIIPGAVSTRSHAVVQSGPVLHALSERLKIDSTIFLPEMPGIKPVRHLGHNNSLLRVPFYWADDYELCKTDRWTAPEKLAAKEGLKVVMFHPVHIFYNTPDIAFYNELRTRFPDLLNLPYDNAKILRHQGQGSGSFFTDLVTFTGNNASYRMKDIPAFYPEI